MKEGPFAGFPEPIGHMLTTTSVIHPDGYEKPERPGIRLAEDQVWLAEVAYNTGDKAAQTPHLTTLQVVTNRFASDPGTLMFKDLESGIPAYWTPDDFTVFELKYCVHGGEPKDAYDPRQDKRPKLGAPEKPAVLENESDTDVAPGQVWLAEIDELNFGRPHNNPHPTVLLVALVNELTGEPKFQDLQGRTNAWFTAAETAKLTLIQLLH